MLVMYTIWEYKNILPLEYLVMFTLDIVQNCLSISSYFDIIQFFFLSV